MAAKKLAQSIVDFTRQQGNAASISGTQKAAILILALGEEQAAEIFRDLEKEDIIRIANALNHLGQVDSTTVETVTREFVAFMKSDQSGIRSADPSQFLQKSLTKAGRQDVGDALNREAPGLPALKSIEPAVLIPYLMKEPPQVVAVILAHLEPERVKSVCAQLPGPLLATAMIRLANLEPVDPEALHDLNSTLESLVREPLKRKSGIGGVQKVAAILANMENNQSRELLDGIEQRDFKLANEISGKMLSIDIFLRLQTNHIQLVLRTINSSDLVSVLKLAPDKVRVKVLENVSERVRLQLQEDIEHKKIARKDAEQALRTVLTTVKSLLESGEIEEYDPSDYV